jgi:hypothetical protein
MAKKVDVNGFSYGLLEKLKYYTEGNKKVISKELEGSLGEKDLFQMSAFSIPNGKDYNGFMKDQDGLYARVGEIEYFGFQGKSYESYEQFVHLIYENEKSKISKKFIEEKVFDWLVKSKKNRKSDREFQMFFDEEKETVLKDFKISYRIENLEISRNFKIGEVSFFFTTEEYWREKFKKKDGNNEYEAMINHFKGSVYASCDLKGYEKERAHEASWELCAYGMDVLKSLFQGENNVLEPIIFEFERRCQHNKSDLSIVESEEEGIVINAQFKNGENLLNEDFLSWLEKDDKESLINTITLDKSGNELIQIAKEAIKYFSDALSNPSIIKKVISLVTIWETLILKGDGSAIKYSLIRYAPKIIYTDIDNRKQLENLISNIYSIRSDYIHHSKVPNLNEEMICHFQRETLSLIITFIQIGGKISTKDELLELIDQEIDKSFNLFNHI